MRCFLVCLLLCLGMIGTAGAATLRVSPVRALQDRPVRIRVSGVAPGQKVVLRLSTTDVEGVAWHAQATFVATANGVVDPSRMAPVAGDYRVLDAMGLFWSMRPPAGRKVSYVPASMVDRSLAKMRPTPYILSAMVDGKQIGIVKLQRQSVAPGIKEVSIRRKDLIANLYVPRGMRHDGRSHAAIIVLGGAEGGIAGGDLLARWLASHGFVTLAMAWYHMPGLQNDLVHVPVVQLVGHALVYLKGLHFVDPQRIALLGGSWGGTVALVAASHLPEVHAVVSWVGSPVVFNGLDRNANTGAYRNAAASPFLIHGRPVPYANDRQLQRFLKTGDPAIVRPALSPIWKIHGPVLFVAGGDDTLGLSAPTARLGMRVLKAHGHAYADQALIYPHAGHIFLPGYRPVFRMSQKIPGIPPVGGTDMGYAHADEACGPDVLAFLHEALAPVPPHEEGQ
jgi:dienelactone hydrolase